MNDAQHEAYRPVIEDGRGIFPEDLRVKAPRGSREAIAAAAWTGACPRDNHACTSAKCRCD